MQCVRGKEGDGVAARFGHDWEIRPFRLATDRPLVIAATLAVFLTSTALTASSDAAAGDLAPPERRAQVMSGYSDWMDIGAALGPPLAFMLAERLGLFPSYGCTAVLLIAVAGWFIVTLHRW